MTVAIENVKGTWYNFEGNILFLTFEMKEIENNCGPDMIRGYRDDSEKSGQAREGLFHFMM